LGLDGDVPDHSTFSKNRHGRFRESDLLRKLFETVVARCIKEKIVGGETFAVDASIVVADAYRRRGVAKVEDLDPTSSRADAEYLYSSGEMVALLVDQRGIQPHVKLVDKSERTDGTFSRSDFVYDPERDFYECLAAGRYEGTAASSPNPATARRRTAGSASAPSSPIAIQERPRAGSFRYGGRDHLGIRGHHSVTRAASSRNWGRLPQESTGGHRR
jgi:hypothetical protein